MLEFHRGDAADQSGVRVAARDGGRRILFRVEKEDRASKSSGCARAAVSTIPAGGAPARHLAERADVPIGAKAKNLDHLTSLIRVERDHFGTLSDCSVRLDHSVEQRTTRPGEPMLMEVGPLEHCAGSKRSNGPLISAVAKELFTAVLIVGRSSQPEHAMAMRTSKRTVTFVRPFTRGGVQCRVPSGAILHRDRRGSGGRVVLSIRIGGRRP